MLLKLVRESQPLLNGEREEEEEEEEESPYLRLQLCSRRLWIVALGLTGGNRGNLHHPRSRGHLPWAVRDISYYGLSGPR